MLAKTKDTESVATTTRLKMLTILLFFRIGVDYERPAQLYELCGGDQLLADI